MREFTLVERTEPFTFKEVIDFIDDTNISKVSACELKSRIVDVIQAERNKAIDEFAKKMKWEYDNSIGVPKKEIDFAKAVIDMVAEQLKGGSDDGK